MLIQKLRQLWNSEHYAVRLKLEMMRVHIVIKRISRSDLRSTMQDESIELNNN